MNFKRVAAWNAARYEQVHVQELQAKLLREEFSETFNAPNAVERLDGHIDVIFVALGAMWKLGCTEQDAAEMMSAAEEFWLIVCDGDDYQGVFERLNAWLTVVEKTLLGSTITANALAMAYATIANLSYLCLDKLGYTTDEALEAAEAVCDSNDSKSIKRTDAAVKANANDKGPYYVPPTARLVKLVEALEARGGKC